MELLHLRPYIIHTPCHLVGVAEFRDLLLVHDQQVGLVVVDLGGRRIAVLHLLALPLGP